MAHIYVSKVYFYKPFRFSKQRAQKVAILAYEKVQITSEEFLLTQYS